MEKRFFDFDPVSRTTQWLSHNSQTGETMLETIQDVEPELETSKALQKDGDYTRTGMKQDMWHYAHIPATLLLKWEVELGVKWWDSNDSKKLWALVNDPEYAHLKTTHLMHKPK